MDAQGLECHIHLICCVCVGSKKKGFSSNSPGISKACQESTKTLQELIAEGIPALQELTASLQGINSNRLEGCY